MTEPTLLYVSKGFQRTARTLETLSETNDLSIGQIFNSVANHFCKDKTDYPRWVSFDKNRSEFYIIKEHIDECASDLEKFNLVCEWLGEENIS